METRNRNHILLRYALVIVGFETLKSLRAENRVVGLISHVEEMQQEVPACLFVENTEERGSVVIIEN